MRLRGVVFLLVAAAVAVHCAPIISTVHLVSPVAARDYTGIYDGGSQESIDIYNSHIEANSRMYYLRVAFTPSNSTLGVKSTFHKDSALVNQFRCLAKTSINGKIITEFTLLTPHWDDFFKLDDTRNTVLYLRVDIGHYPWPENGTLFLEYTALPDYVELGIKDRGDDTFLQSVIKPITVDNGPFVVQYVDPHVLDAKNLTYVMFNKPVKLNTQITTWNVTWADYCGIQSADKQWYLNRTAAPYAAIGTADANGFSRFWLLPTHNETTTITTVTVNKFVCPQIFVDKNGVLSPNSNLIREWRGAEGDLTTLPQPLVYGAMGRIRRGGERPTARLQIGDLESTATLRDLDRDGLYDSMDVIFTGRVLENTATPAMFDLRAYFPATQTSQGLFVTTAHKNFSGDALEDTIIARLAGVSTGVTANDNVIKLAFIEFNDDLLYRYMDGGALLMLVPKAGLNLYLESNSIPHAVTYEDIDDGYFHIFSPPITIAPIVTAPETTYTYNLTAGYGYFTTTFAKPLDIFRRLSTETPAKSTVGRNGMVDYGLQLKPTKQTPTYSSRNDPAVILTTRSISHTVAMNNTCFDDRFQSFRNDSTHSLYPSKVVTSCRSASLTTPLDPRSLGGTHAGNLHPGTVWWTYSGTSAYPWFSKRAVAISNFVISTNNTYGMPGASSSLLTGSPYLTFPYDPIVRTYTPVSTLKRGNNTAPHGITWTVLSTKLIGSVNKTMYNYTFTSSTPIWKASLNMNFTAGAGNDVNITCMNCKVHDAILVESTAWGVTKFNVSVTDVPSKESGDIDIYLKIDLSRTYDVNGFGVWLADPIPFYDENKGGGMSDGAITGTVVGSILGAVVLLAGGFYVAQYCKAQSRLARGDSVPTDYN